MTKQAVIGATGFFGRNLLEGLKKNDVDVLGVSRSGKAEVAGVKTIAADITDKASLVRALQGVEVVYQTAGIDSGFLLPRRDPFATELYKINVQGLVNVIEAARECGVRRVIATTSATTFGTSGGFFENYIEQASPYVWSRVMSEHASLSYNGDGIEIVILAPAFVFGRYDRGQTSGNMLLSFLNKKARCVPRWSWGMMGVHDYVRWNIAASEAPVAGRRFLLASESLSLKHLLSEAAKITGQEGPIEIADWQVRGIGLAAKFGAQLIGRIPATDFDWLAKSMSSEWKVDAMSVTHEALGMPEQSMRDTIAEAVDWFFESGQAKR